MASPASPETTQLVKIKPPLTLDLHKAQIVFIPTDGFRKCFVTSLWVYTTHTTPTQEESDMYEENKEVISVGQAINGRKERD